MSSPAPSRLTGEMQATLQRAPRQCAVCGVAGSSLDRYIEHLFFERVTDIDTRAAIRQARGFCRRHARMISQHADALGTSLIMQDVLTNDLRDMTDGAYARLPEEGRSLSRLFGAARSTTLDPCPLCTTESEYEALAVDTLLAALPDSQFSALYRATSGICMRHFRLAHGRCRDATVWEAVLAVQRAALPPLIAELAEFARKADYRYSGEPMGEERDAWRRALDTSSGAVET